MRSGFTSTLSVALLVIITEIGLDHLGVVVDCLRAAFRDSGPLGPSR